MVYQVQAKTGNAYTRNNVQRVAIPLFNGLIADITQKQFDRYFKGMSPDDTAGVSIIVDFYDKGETNEIKDAAGNVTKSTTFTDGDKIVRSIDVVRSDVGIRTVATAIAITMERRVVTNVRIVSPVVELTAFEIAKSKVLAAKAKAGDEKLDLGKLDGFMTELSPEEKAELTSLATA